MAKISFDRAVHHVEDILDNVSPSPRRTFMLEQVIRSMVKGIDKKNRIQKANHLVLVYDLDLHDNIPLYRTFLT